MKVYMVRHGESVNNLEKKWTGWMDVPLTDKGREEAKQVGKILSEVSFDKIYSSDLSRAVETAMLAIPGCEPETTPLLREVNVGTLEGKTLDLSDDDTKRLSLKRDYSYFGGESTEQLSARISEFMRILENSNDETVAVFAHAGVLRTVLRLVLETAVPAQRLRCFNCCVMVFDYTDGFWSLYCLINQN